MIRIAELGWQVHMLNVPGGRRIALAARVLAPDSCQLPVRAGSVKAVFACTFRSSRRLSWQRGLRILRELHRSMSIGAQ